MVTIATVYNSNRVFNEHLKKRTTDLETCGWIKMESKSHARTVEVLTGAPALNSLLVLFFLITPSP
jgi:hypothetical protein